ncbi:putative Zinc finger, SWIM-type, MULE transposase domain, FHY3/FAR1 family [Helianthus annuus]|nr:putative Zinc finger, SWIM-type, MULE transposase domain, FHY3/FAR1 family [Helianthus annuus]
MLALLETCRVATQRDDGFTYNYTTDENGKIENVSWAYGDSIRAFSVFGDVVTFETTYRSITYNMLLGVWFGIDNQGRAFLLGCVLLQDETSQSFSWALQAFIQFLRGNHPQTIVTDIDSGLRNAIATELPNTKHVICVWHVLSKLSSWFSLSLGLQYPEFKTEFELVCHLENIEDFENQWNHLMARFGIESDKHVSLLFSYRAFWPVAYIRGYFLARTMTIDYMKSVDKFMKNILSPHSSFKNFFEQVSVAASVAFQNKERVPNLPLKTCLPLEEHARSILSPYAFNALQQELVLCMQYAATDMANGSFLVRHYNKLEGECLVIWIPDNEQVHCSCKEYEHSGILCRHSLRVLVLKNYFQIPEKYFPLRWRLDSSLVISDDQITSQDNADECSEAFHSLTSTLYAESLISKERFNYVHRELTQVVEIVRNMPVFDEVTLDLAPNNVSEL